MYNYNLRVKTFTPPMAAQVEDFKAYIGQSGSAADVFVAAKLTEALINVGEYEDRSLVVATYELEWNRESNAPVKLYGTPNQVLAVTDWKGNALAFEHTAGSKYVSIPDKAEIVRISYTTSVDAGAVASLLGKVWEYGKARYEGRDTDAAAILMR